MLSYTSVNNNRIQPETRLDCITIGRLAPDFVGLSTLGYISLSSYRGKWVVLASNPSAFGAVATTEIIDAALHYDSLLERNAYYIAMTTDNVYANLAWEYDINQTIGITIPFPIIGDADLVISNLYGMLNPDRVYGETVRNTFIINPVGRITAIYTLPVSTGKSIEEIIRVIDSMQIKENYNLNTPAGWQPGDPLLLPNTTSYEEIVNRMNNKEALGYNCPFWYVCYTNLNPENSNNINNINNIRPT